MTETAYGGIEIFFTYTPSDLLSIFLVTNIMGLPSFANSEDEVVRAVSVKISSRTDVSGKIFVVVSTYLASTEIDKSDYPRDFEEYSVFNVRVFLFNDRISVYINSKWVYSYCLGAVSYPDVITQSLNPVGDGVTVTNVRVVELCDGREAVYVDYESTSDNAISSIIQERPIEVLSAVGRAAEFTYGYTKNNVGAQKIDSYDESEADNSQMSSDGLVYARDVSISIDTYIAEHFGLITRLYRLPDIDNGIARAIKAIQRKARQSIYHVDTAGRLDPRLEVADVHVFDNVIVTGTGRVINVNNIIEDIGITISDGVYRQTTKGRREIS